MPLPFLIAGVGALISGATAVAGTAAAGAAAVGAAAASTAAAVGTAAAGTAAAVGGAATAAAGTAAAIGTAAAGTAAAIGTTAAGTAAAIGTTAAGTAAAIGGTVAGTVASVGSAAAGTAIGSATIGAMGAVGTGVGAVAGAASSAPLIGGAAGTLAAMTGTTAGAAAVGTITTTRAIGAVNGVAGVAKLSEASDIKDRALSKYNSEKKRFDLGQREMNAVLEKLGKSKLKIWESFDRFSEMYSKIQNPPVMVANVDEESLTITVDELNNVRAVAIAAKDLMSGGIASVSAGNLIGLATSGGLVSSITVASTGTAISSLSGAAATNATLAALGGGALNVGGAGMAGGAAALGGLTVAPALMVSGIMLNHKAGEALENAKDVEREATTAVGRMKELEIKFGQVKILSGNIYTELETLYGVYSKHMDDMECIVQKKTDYRQFTTFERRKLEKTVLSLKLLKKLSTQNLLVTAQEDVVLDDQVEKTYSYVVEEHKKNFASI